MHWCPKWYTESLFHIWALSLQKRHVSLTHQAMSDNCSKCLWNGVQKQLEWTMEWINQQMSNNHNNQLVSASCRTACRENGNLVRMLGVFLVVPLNQRECGCSAEVWDFVCIQRTCETDERHLHRRGRKQPLKQLKTVLGRFYMQSWLVSVLSVNNIFLHN